MRILFLLGLSLFIVGCLDSDDGDDITLSDLEGTWAVSAYTVDDEDRAVDFASRDALDGQGGRLVIDAKGYIELWLADGTVCYDLDSDFYDDYKIKDLGDGEFEVSITNSSEFTVTKKLSASFSGDSLKISFDDKSFTVSESDDVDFCKIQ